MEYNNTGRRPQAVIHCTAFTFSLPWRYFTAWSKGTVGVPSKIYAVLIQGTLVIFLSILEMCLTFLHVGGYLGSRIEIMAPREQRPYKLFNPDPPEGLGISRIQISMLYDYHVLQILGLAIFRRDLVDMPLLFPTWLVCIHMSYS